MGKKEKGINRKKRTIRKEQKIESFRLHKEGKGRKKLMCQVHNEDYEI